MINKKYNFIHIHITKNAGVSIEKLFNNPIGDHRTVKAYINQIGYERYKKYYSFAFIRNPWDKMVSNYEYDKKGGHDGKRKKFGADKLSFKEWLKVLNKYPNKPPKTYMNQYDWLTNHKNELDVDYIGRFENIDDDWKYICDKININMELPHYNKTKEKNYKSYYDDESYEIVKKYYIKDINYFNYEF